MIEISATEGDNQAIFDNLNSLSNFLILEQLHSKATKIPQYVEKVTPNSDLLLLGCKVIQNKPNEIDFQNMDFLAFCKFCESFFPTPGIKD